MNLNLKRILVGAMCLALSCVLNAQIKQFDITAPKGNQSTTRTSTSTKTQSKSSDILPNHPVDPGEYENFVLFSYGSATVEEQEKRGIKKLASYLKANPDAQLKLSRVSAKSPLTGQNIDESRALAVRKILVDNYGINSSRITIVPATATNSLQDFSLVKERIKFYTDSISSLNRTIGNLRKEISDKNAEIADHSATINQLKNTIETQRHKSKRYDQAEIDGLNAKINDLRNQISAKDQRIAADAPTIKKLHAELSDCRSQKKSVSVIGRIYLEETGINWGDIVVCRAYNTQAEMKLSKDVFFSKNESTISIEQSSRVCSVANYLNLPSTKVTIVGYTAPDEKTGSNLSIERAMMVKNMLIEKFGISASRINVEDGGRLNVSWGAVAVCVISK